MEEMPGAAAALNCHRSGVAARLAGIPVETLRVWERRYRVAGPRLSEGGQRLYSAADIRRLTLVKALVDQGHPIGTVAGLPTETLLTLRAATNDPLPKSDEPLPALRRVALVGPVVAGAALHDALTACGLQVVQRLTDPAEARGSDGGEPADLLVLELPALNDHTPRWVAQVAASCGTPRVLVLYRFGPGPVIARLRTAGHEVMHVPPDIAEVVARCRQLLRSPLARRPEPGSPPPPARFGPDELSRLAAASTTVYCECPRHLVELVTSLSSFERYSAECGARGLEDALLHRDLQFSAGHARALLEDMLVRVALAEGLPVPAAGRES